MGKNKVGNLVARQGDVGLIWLGEDTTVPQDSKEIEFKAIGPRLAVGEVTGHAHHVVSRPEVDMGEAILEEVREMIAEVRERTRIEKIVTDEPAAKLYEIEGEEDNLLIVTRPTALVHHSIHTSALDRTHRPIWLDPGSYGVRIQRELTPEGIRNVQD